MKALAKSGRDRDLAVTSEQRPPPQFTYTLPLRLVEHAWLEREHTGRYFDSDLPPDLQDTELRQNVEEYDYQWRYELAMVKGG
jgi:hypothetical protein